MANSARALKRLTKDIQMVYQEQLEKDGIYINVNEENIFNIKVMVVGPKDTPYQHGYYFFTLQFPQNYPENPPVAKFITTDGRIRFNPNLYQCGKVCLSLLNTFSGPAWTLCQNLKAILLALQTVLNENPLTNEPGFENTSRHHSDCYTNYNTIVRYHNYAFAILQMFAHIPRGFEMFQPLMREHFLANYSSIIEDLTRYHHLQNHKINTYYGMSYVVNFPNLIPQMVSLYSLFNPEPTENAKASSSAINDDNPEKEMTISLPSSVETMPPPPTDPVIVAIHTVKKNKQPPSKASSHPVGYTEEFENQMYIVYADKANHLRWKRQI
jgi:ubiquitin-protein ligase